MTEFSIKELSELISKFDDLYVNYDKFELLDTVLDILADIFNKEENYLLFIKLYKGKFFKDFMKNMNKKFLNWNNFKH